ncbi:hypothetical protein JX266_010003 [Neoarthrinium moseri]|nr:hypothetical protein JX266_010003 [Neoarthrinium moseri]
MATTSDTPQTTSSENTTQQAMTEAPEDRSSSQATQGRPESTIIIHSTRAGENLPEGQSTETFQIHDTPPPKEISSPLPWKESVGLYGCSGILGGSALVLGVIGFLSFLWFGKGTVPEAAKASWLWRRIALADWMTQTITICALVLRLVISIQAGICTSMIAALVLENHHALIRKSQAAYVSVLRGVNDGPRKLIQILLSSRTLSVLASFEIWLMMLLGMLTLVLQFSSTILLSDLRDFVVAGDASITTVANLLPGHSMEELNSGFGVMLQTSPIYGIFGESESSVDSSPSPNGFSDTGLVQRGYIPVPDKDARSSVRQYRGNTLVSSSRVSCLAPKMEASFSNYTSDAGAILGRITGTLHYGEALTEARPGTDTSPLCRGGECESTPFECLTGSSLYGSTQSVFCFIGNVGGTLKTLHDLNWRPDDPPWAVNSSIYLVLSTNMTQDDWYSLSESHEVPMRQTDDEWITFQPVEGRSVDISLCFTRFVVNRRFVDLSRNGPTLEPVMTWGKLSYEHSSSSVLNMFDTDTPRTPSERGLLEMDILSGSDGWIPANNTTFDTDSPGTRSSGYNTSAILMSLVITPLTDLFTPNMTLIACIQCVAYGSVMHPELVYIFEDTLRSTRRSANAFQNLIGALASASYDNLLSSLSVPEEVKMSSTSTVRAPGSCITDSCSGFISVATLLGVHMVTVWAIAVMYAVHVRYSRVSNIWHAVSQLFGVELHDAMTQANNASDAVVDKQKFSKGKDSFVRLGPLEDDSAIGIVASRGTDRKPVSGAKTDDAGRK